MMSDLHARARRIRLAAFDVDGVLTDGTLYFTGSGEEMKAFNVRDGHGMKMLQAAGIRLAVITSRSSSAVEARARGLGVDFIYQGAADKGSALDELLVRAGVKAEEVAYMGDDVIDLPVLTRCGLAATVPDAPAAVLRHVHYVTRAGGGRGAVREMCELILQARDADPASAATPAR
jgi:3-deoxy-D-manno-octulosonate 8-phosphate phosphatase (KDO 8-P phosphatase)